MPIQFEKNVPNLNPITAAREMYEPFHKLKFAFAASYYDQMRVFAPKLAKEKGAKKVCTMYQDDEFGLEVMRGAEAGLKTIGMTLAEKTTYKRGATDFSSQVARLKAAGCDMVILGTIIRETIGTIGTARKYRLQPDLPGLERGLHRPHPQTGGQGDEWPVRRHDRAEPLSGLGLAATALLGHQVQDQVQRGPTVFSVYGYTAIDNFITPRKAGPNLTTDSFIKALETVTFPADMFGSPVTKFGPTKRQGSDQARLSQIVDGKWKVLN
jgi:branched-chain amino acid transport system substrate-binding protein